MSTNLADRASESQPDRLAGGAKWPHTVQFYDDDAVMADATSNLIGAALTTGDATIVMATREHRDGIAARLDAAGLDLDRAVGSGHYTAIDAAETLAQVMVDGRVDEARFTSVIGGHLRRAASARFNPHRPVVVFGELVALLAAEGEHEAAIEIERCWNALSETYPIALQCGYPMRAFSHAEDGEALERICDAHTAVQPAESYTALPTDDERSRMMVLLQHKAQALEGQIAERRRAEEALQEQNRALQAALSARDEFLAVAAHELRTPVTELRGYAQMLLRNIESGRGIPPERMSRPLSTIERLSNQLSQLVGRLLDATQIESGTLRITPAPTDLVALVQSVIAHQPSRETHAIGYEGPAHLDAMVDSVRFEQVIGNLIDNAIRYSPNGGSVTANIVDRRPDGIEISVTDSGLGIPMDERDAVFTSFRHARDGVRSSGIGLGLFVSRQIVELHGGSMRIEDPDHPGTRIVVTLPG